MKKLFTLVALLACFMGAKAEWIEDYKIDYSTYNGFPFFVMGYVPEWFDGVMTDFGASYRYATQETLDGNGDDKWKDGETSVGTVTTSDGTEYQKVTGADPYWHQYFMADGIPTELDGKYTVKAMVKASEACTINVNMGWGWGSGESASANVSIGTEWEEVEWEYSGIGGTSCNLVAQPGTVTATIEWKYLTVSHNAKPQRPVEWIEQLVNGNAESAWPDWSLAKNDEGININWRSNRSGEICAWSLQMGTNAGDTGADGSLDGRARPFPADIVADPDNASNHVFMVDASQIEKIDEDNSIQWSNQFWIQSPQAWKEGTKVKLHFRYKADIPAKAGTQIHKQNPSEYLHWEAIGDVNFTTEWQEFDKEFTFNASQANGWSVAFNLCAESTVDSPQPANKFYFDDLSWKIMKLDEGYFVAGSNPAEGLEYDFDNAVQFEYDDETEYYEATIGEKNAYVSQIMISTVRGNDAAFKGATLKPTGTIKNDPDKWNDYEAASLAKINLPGAGIWKIYIDEEYKSMAFEMLEGTIIERVEIKPNPTVVVVHGQEREYTESEAEAAGLDKPNPAGQPWDNQFFIIANRTLSAGEATVVEFDYVSTVDARTSTQDHVAPGAYLHFGSIGDVNFTTEEQHFSANFTIPAEADGMQSIAFNMAEIKEACDYTIKNIVWKLDDNTESLIDQTGTKNFYVKEGAGTDPYEFGTDPDGISSVVTKSNAPAAIFNLAGQRVNNGYKGLVVKNGSKFMVK